jgi:hypothetical protein
MQRKSTCIVGLGVAAAMLSFIANLEVEVAVARTGAAPIPVNRALKGDRMPAVTDFSSAQPTAMPRMNDPKLPDECHASFNPKKNLFSAEVAGRCLG